MKAIESIAQATVKLLEAVDAFFMIYLEKALPFFAPSRSKRLTLAPARVYTFFTSIHKKWTSAEWIKLCVLCPEKTSA